MMACEYDVSLDLFKVILQRVNQKDPNTADRYRLKSEPTNLHGINKVLPGYQIENQPSFHPIQKCLLQKSRFELLRELILSHFEVNYHGKEEDPPICIALNRCHSIEVIELLIQAGADVVNSHTCKYQMFPLHIAAARNSSEDIVRLLLQAGADVSKRNSLGQLPIEIAFIAKCKPEVVNLITRKSERSYLR